MIILSKGTPTISSDIIPSTVPRVVSPSKIERSTNIQPYTTALRQISQTISAVSAKNDQINTENIKIEANKKQRLQSESQ